MRRGAEAPHGPDLSSQLEPWEISAIAHDDAFVEVELKNMLSDTLGGDGGGVERHAGW